MPRYLSEMLCSCLPKQVVLLVVIVGSKPRQALLFESVLEYVSAVAWVDSRTQESQRGHNGLSWFRAIDALCPAADDP